MHSPDCIRSTIAELGGFADNCREFWIEADREFWIAAHDEIAEAYFIAHPSHFEAILNAFLGMREEAMSSGPSTGVAINDDDMVVVPSVTSDIVTRIIIAGQSRLVTCKAHVVFLHPQPTFLSALERCVANSTSTYPNHLSLPKSCHRTPPRRGSHRPRCCSHSTVGSGRRNGHEAHHCSRLPASLLDVCCRKVLRPRRLIMFARQRLINSVKLVPSPAVACPCPS
jgi:hypothetical protein